MPLSLLSTTTHSFNVLSLFLLKKTHSELHPSRNNFVRLLAHSTSFMIRSWRKKKTRELKNTKARKRNSMIFGETRSDYSKEINQRMDTAPPR